VRAADLRAQVDVRQDERVVNGYDHSMVIAKACYRGMKCALKSVQR
jgi:hypothetical protein